jgi:hypothetical protein
MLQSKSFHSVSLWPRGVQLDLFNPTKRSVSLRASWGVGEVRRAQVVDRISQCSQAEVAGKKGGMEWEGGTKEAGMRWRGSLPLTPPASPWVQAVGAQAGSDGGAVHGNEADQAWVEQMVQEPEDLETSGLPARTVLMYAGRL